ncbi:TetR/AcrR family transcriptional regulator [Actinomycetospora termitidis]|uniref:TetR family transcriptional regulator n=1 Tax=Actinomycetospora termitidis TaxID=3053470 RepID=A0ABT7MA13_9PSEU|nr:TetR family transcriptional regulator [Actinomycetospora sp. Odt1-22]MDL5157492.1 TetR family transcriptional regulator [Actinomycetospora sp. Odt1-22]
MARRAAGRRPGDSGTREAILAAARARFTEQGFRETTMRSVAAAADVDPALVHHFFGSKEGLFATAMAFPFNPADMVAGLLAQGVDGLGERLVRTLLVTFARLGPANPMIALLRSAVGHPPAAQMLREFLTGAVLDPVASAVRADRPRLRAELCASQVVGILVAREVVELPELRAADTATLVAAYGPTLQRYLTADL